MSHTKKIYKSPVARFFGINSENFSAKQEYSDFIYMYENPRIQNIFPQEYLFGKI